MAGGQQSGSEEIPRVFISYSHESPEHDEQVLKLADRLRREGVDAWIDRYEPHPPQGWPRWMQQQIEIADFVLLVCTETYCRRFEGREAPGRGLGVAWEGLLINQLIYEDGTINEKCIPVQFAQDQKAIPAVLRPYTRYLLERDYETLYRRLTGQQDITPPPLGKKKELPEKPIQSRGAIQRISLERLPTTDSTLFGRENELALLNNAWDDPQTSIVTLVAFGGIGKTALVNRWLDDFGNTGYGGATRVFGWSFYSQGADEKRQASADEFIASALKWFGDEDPTAGSPWDKGQRLAELIRQEPTLLILDGMEPLQNPPGVFEGELKDPSLKCLLRGLSRGNPGLCVISTRLPVEDVKGSEARQVDLENLSISAGVVLLRHLKLEGSEKELGEAVAEFEGHALALNLLGEYLRIVHDGDIRQRDKIAKLTDARKQGAHARRVMESYSKWFKGKSELDILHMLGLFDRAAEEGAIKALREGESIDGLTTNLANLTDADWAYAIDHLRTARLLAKESEHHSGTLDAHPLVREHFGEELEATNSEAFKEGHRRLYEYLQSVPGTFQPDTLDEMAPLYAAVHHGCKAGLHQEVMDEVFQPRIRRKNEDYSAKKLGACAADLKALAEFFTEPWTQVSSGLTEPYNTVVLNWTGYRLIALGRLSEASRPLRASLDARVARRDWKAAAIDSVNLCDLHLAQGAIPQALEYAEQGVKFADRSADTFLRITRRSTQADALHQAGRIYEAANLFIETEQMQKEYEPTNPHLYALQGFYCCDLLLTYGNARDVLTRTGQTIKWIEHDGGPFYIALDHLILGRAYLAMAQAGEDRHLTQAHKELDEAVDGLREAGTQHHLPRGLLARAEYSIFTRNFPAARTDLTEALEIAERSGMRLFEADAHLGFARLYLAQDDLTKAREHLAIAKPMITEMGYHRRDPEVKKLERELGLDTDPTTKPH